MVELTNLRKLLISVVAAVMLTAPLSGAALADTAPTDTTTTVPAATPAATTPAATPSTDTTAPAASTTTSPASPTPDPKPAPASTDPAPTAPTTQPAAVSAPTTQATPQTGPTDTTGKVPDWVFNTLTNKWEPADQSSFTWDKASGYWLSPKYVYDTRMGWYKIVPLPVSGQSPPSYYLQAPAPAATVSTPIGDFVVGSPEYQLAKSLGILVDPNDPAISNTGPNSANLGQVNNASTALIDFTNIARLANNLKSAAASGNANVSGNTNGGDAQTGSAAVMANVVNLLNSVWHTSAGPVITFVKNIFGDVFGDMVLTTPTQSSPAVGSGGSASNALTGPNSSNQASLTNSNDVTVHASTDTAINNDINLAAQSGNANVTGNTRGGSATTGDASVALNLINMINSAISSNGSFLGILNIYGNFNGDVLFSPDFMTQVLQAGGQGSSAVGNANTGPNSINSATIANTDNMNLSATTRTGITNNVDATATSGGANVGGNTAAGSARTGAADTHSSVLNLQGQNVAGDNAMLVIVNVLGHWLGGIMALPGNISSALLGSGNSTATNADTGPNSTNNANVTNTNNLSGKVTNNAQITNNAKIKATSGDANVSGNTNAGNATSGKASVLSSVANLTNTVVNVRKWFGILIINVFGNWTGSVGKDTSAGNLPSQIETGQISGSAAAAGTGITTVPTGGTYGGTVTPSSESQTSAVTSSATAPNQLVAASLLQQY
jgi:hypothetical protein